MDDMPEINHEEIRRRAKHLLNRITIIRDAGQGGISTLELLELADIPLDEALRRKIEARGEIVLSYRTPTSGSFINTGNAFMVPMGPMKLQVPVELSGTFTDCDGCLTLNLDSGHTFSGKVLFMEMKVKSLEVSDSHVAIRFPTKALDREIVF